MQYQSTSKYTTVQMFAFTGKLLQLLQEEFSIALSMWPREDHVCAFILDNTGTGDLIVDLELVPPFNDHDEWKIRFNEKLYRLLRSNEKTASLIETFEEAIEHGGS